MKSLTALTIIFVLSQQLISAQEIQTDETIGAYIQETISITQTSQKEIYKRLKSCVLNELELSEHLTLDTESKIKVKLSIENPEPTWVFPHEVTSFEFVIDIKDNKYRITMLEVLFVYDGSKLYDPQAFTLQDCMNNLYNEEGEINGFFNRLINLAKNGYKVFVTDGFNRCAKNQTALTDDW
ncbi:hypothetical protein [Marinoscillum furvescens]|uniref:DUF4468 domain-containing protein n=1 Tax=Marinoscillum furvescens DSM 4134 TaxID=1122208 RepID=A0A3D9KXX5_MARFU|nr:hypothetical protein [Marinoscillum furvescens]RED92998.1 hypothetical protein C7460_12722 [Marinoscillum furvescens DSM 4134]